MVRRWKGRSCTSPHTWCLLSLLGTPGHAVLGCYGGFRTGEGPAPTRLRPGLASARAVAVVSSCPVWPLRVEGLGKPPTEGPLRHPGTLPWARSWICICPQPAPVTSSPSCPAPLSLTPGPHHLLSHCSLLGNGATTTPLSLPSAGPRPGLCVWKGSLCPAESFQPGVGLLRPPDHGLWAKPPRSAWLSSWKGP